MRQLLIRKHDRRLLEPRLDAILFSNRIPKDFFITIGTGESDIQVHAGSYHLALKDAGIEIFNHMTYSSILPAIANKIEKPKYFDPSKYGSVMEGISAVANSRKGKIATAAIIYGWLYNKATGEKFGGLVCEYNGNHTEKEAAKSLEASLNEIYEKGFSDDYKLSDINLISKSFIPTKEYGTAIVAICFTSYLYPLLSNRNKRNHRLLP